MTLAYLNSALLIEIKPPSKVYPKRRTSFGKINISSGIQFINNSISFANCNSKLISLSSLHSSRPFDNVFDSSMIHNFYELLAHLEIVLFWKFLF